MSGFLRSRLTVRSVIFALSVALLPSLPARASAPAGLVGTASVIPGLGQTLNGNIVEGVGWFGSIFSLYFLNSNSGLRQVGWDLWMYNMYDAYRDAKPKIKRYANHNVAQNYLAAFNPLNVLDPVGASVVGVAAFSGYSVGYPALRLTSVPLVYGVVGMGEEGLFRGFLFPAFSDLFHSAILGSVVSSVAFGLIHATGGVENLQPLVLGQRIVFGLIFCYQAHRNRYDLRKSIFAHTWYDILVDRGGKIDGLKVMIPILRF